MRSRDPEGSRSRARACVFTDLTLMCVRYILILVRTHQLLLFPLVSDSSGAHTSTRWDTALSVAVVVSLNEKWMRLKLDQLKLDQVNLQNVLKVRKTAGFTIPVCGGETLMQINGETRAHFFPKLTCSARGNAVMFISIR